MALITAKDTLPTSSVSGALLPLMMIATLALARPARPAPPIEVQRSATGGAGTSTDPWTGWESAFDPIGVDGAEIDFAPGYYKENVPVTLPVNAMGWLHVNGNGATIQLTAAAPRFLTPNVTADYQTVRLVRIQDFTVDATLATGKNNVIFGDYVDGSGLNGIRRVDWDQIVVKRVRAHGLTVDATTNTHLGGINLAAFQEGDGEVKRNTITNIDIEDVRIEGGNWGILIYGAGPGTQMNVDIDNVRLVRCWHSLMARQAVVFPSSNFQVGNKARVGRVHVIDCYGQFSADTGLELNSVADGLVTGTEIDDALVGDFYYTDFTVPGGAPHVTWDNCKAAITGALGSSVYGSGWFVQFGAAGSVPGEFVVSNSTYTRSASSVSKFGAAVTMLGSHASLTLRNVEFSWRDADVDSGSARLVYLSPSDDFTLTVRGAKLSLAGTRWKGANGLKVIELAGSGAAKTVTLDVDGVHASAALTGTAVNSTIALVSVAGAAADTITGVVSDSSFESRGGDAKARGVSVDLTNLDIASTLRFVSLDGSRLPVGGATVALDHATCLAEATQAQMIGVIEPAHPATPVFSGDGVCTKRTPRGRLLGCFTPVDPAGDDQSVLSGGRSVCSANVLSSGRSGSASRQ